jgi:hypothetical protein
MSAILICFTAISVIPEPGTLSGQVTDDSGRPIAGARVDIWTGRPKVGIGST